MFSILIFRKEFLFIEGFHLIKMNAIKNILCFYKISELVISHIF